MPTPPDDNSQHFGNMLPPEQQWFTPKEVAAIIGRSDQFVRDAYDNQKIFGHQNNGRARKGKERRRTYQIHREGILFFLLETANFRPKDFLECLKELLRNRSPQQLLELQHWLASRTKQAARPKG
jgi:hypothetical protein